LTGAEGHTGGVLSVAVHDNQIISGSIDKTIKMWDRTTGCLIRTFSGHTNRVQSVCFSNSYNASDLRYNASDLRYNLIISGSNDNTIKLWDPMTGETIRTIVSTTGYAGGITLVKVHGNQIISGSYSDVIKIWDLTTGNLLYTMCLSMGHANFLVHDNKVISGGYHHAIKIWDLETGCIIHTLGKYMSFVSSIV
jgi:WD40 repeat protein